MNFLISLVMFITITVSSVIAEERINVYTRFPTSDATSFAAIDIFKQLNEKFNGVYDFRISSVPGFAGEAADGKALAEANLGFNTIVIGSLSNFSINNILYDSPLNREVEFVPIELLVRIPNAVMVNPDSGIESMSDLVKYIKSKKTAYYAATLQAITPSLLDSIMKTHYNFDNIEILRYKTPGDVAKSVIMKESDYTIMNPIDTSGLKLLMISFPKRDSFFPSVPTGIESGISDFDYTSSILLYIPKKNDKFIEKIRTAIHDSCVSDRVKEITKKVMLTPVCNNDEKWLRAEIERQKALAIKHKEFIK